MLHPYQLDALHNTNCRVIRRWTDKVKLCNKINTDTGTKKIRKKKIRDFLTKKDFESGAFLWVGRVRANKHILFYGLIFNISICFSEITGPIETKPGRVRVLMSHATFNNISAISWRSVLLVEETGVHGKIHRPVASHRNNLVRIFIGWSNTKFMLFVPIRN
jgi:hypothetical protein